jgi:hypothetical protein
MAAGIDDLVLVNTLGDIFVCTVNNGRPAVTRVIPQQPRSLRFESAAIGQDRTLIAVSDGRVFTGSIFPGCRRKTRANWDDVFIPFKRVGELDNITDVVASSSGAFAAIRKESEIALQFLPNVPWSGLLRQLSGAGDVLIFEKQMASDLVLVVGYVSSLL